MGLPLEGVTSVDAVWRLIQRGDIKRAEVLVARILRDAGEDAEQAVALLARAQCKLLSGRPQEALEDWEQARALAPTITEQPATLELRADAHFALYEMSSVGFAGHEGQETSARLYRQLIAEYPDYANRGWLHYQLGRVLLTANRIEEASAQFQTASTSPSHLPALPAYCNERLAFVAYYEERDLQRALGYLEQALRRYPAQASREWLVEILLMRARVTLELRRLPAARRSLDEALRIADSQSPQRPPTLYAAAEILMKMPTQEVAAIPLLEEFLQLSKQPPGIDVSWARAHELLGEAYFRCARYQDAVHAYRLALHHNPYSPWSSTLRYQLACAYYQSGDYDRTCECLGQLIAAEADEGGAIQDFRVYDLLGNAHFALGRYDEALTSYSRALSLTPPHTQESAQIRRYHDYARRRIAE